MKVLHVINSLVTGGAEKLILDTLPIFAETVQVDLFLIDGTPYPFLKKFRKNNNINVFTSYNVSVYNPFHILKLMKYLNKYDVVHVHLFPAQYWVAIAHSLMFSKAKLVFTEHCTTNRRMDNVFFRGINKLVYYLFDRTICISEEIQNIYKNYTRLDLERLPMIENGIDLNIIKEAKPIPKSEIASGIESNDKLIIQVSGFMEQKDQRTLIKSMTLLPKNIKLLLVGDGVTLSGCKAMAEKLELGDRVFFLGLRTDIPELLKSSDIVVLSSHYEGLSLASIEGMASSRPFIASDVPGLSDLVDGAGVLFPEGNEEKLAAILKKLIDKKEYYDQVVKSSMNKAKNYDINQMVYRYIQVYNNII